MCSYVAAVFVASARHKCHRLSSDGASQHALTLRGTSVARGDVVRPSRHAGDVARPICHPRRCCEAAMGDVTIKVFTIF